MLNLIAATTGRALAPIVIAMKPEVILAVGAASVMYSVARAIDRSGGIEEIEISLNSFKAKFTKTKFKT